MRVRLSRRTVLRGGAVAVGLPVLDAMMNDRGLLFSQAHAQAQKPPVRLFTFFLPNGFPGMNRFVPVEKGRTISPTVCTDPIKHLMPDWLMFTNVTGVGGPDSHAAGICAFGTGVGSSTRGAKGPSIDQIAAQRKGQSTKFSSLVVAVQKSGTWSSNGHTSDNFVNVSWQGADQAAPAERDPLPLFGRLFSGGLPGTQSTGTLDKTALENIQKNQKSVLDYVVSDITRLKPRLGASDNQRLDAHLTGIRELERRVTQFQSAPACQVPPAPMVPKTQGHYAKAFMQVDLLATAIKCGLTNYASFMYADGAGHGGPDSAIMLAGQQHEDTHAAKIDSMTNFTTWQMKAFARFLDHLKGTPEGDKNLLYNSLVYMGTELGNGTAHAKEDLKIILAGNAGGAFQPGGRITYATPPKLGSFLLSVLKLAGIDEPNFTFAGTNQTVPLTHT